MSRAMHLITKNVPGYGPSDGRCLPCLGVSGRAVAVSPCSSRGDYKTLSQVKTVSLRWSSKRGSVVCMSSSSGQRRNPDFSRQRKHNFSRNRNRQNEERDSLEHLEESDMLSSKNGPILSISNSPKFQATATPGPREKEIVELFRKVQAQLRERAAIKEDKKIEALQGGQGKESETVDSLLKLLRKHSVEQSKRRNSGSGSSSSSSSSSSSDFLDQPAQNGSFNVEKTTNFFDTLKPPIDEPQETNGSSFVRPRSNFRRKSPVPQVKFQPIYSGEDTVNSVPHVNSDGKRKKSPSETRPEPEPAAELEPEPELELELETKTEAVLETDLEPEAIFAVGDVYDELSEGESSSDTEAAYTDEDTEKQEPIENGDLSTLKLLELNALAKSRGMKGFSKLKKSELVELLVRTST